MVLTACRERGVDGNEFKAYKMLADVDDYRVDIQGHVSSDWSVVDWPARRV